MLILILAITCVDGNTSVDNVVKNVAILTGVKNKKVPIYKGMNGPIIKTKRDASAYHGSDGFGHKQEDWLNAADLDNIQKEHAVNAIVKHVNEEHNNGNEVGVFTVGPMSNLAMAIRMDPDIIQKIKHVYVMGGTVNGWGNMTLTGEFNFLSDPEAAKICIGSFQMTHLLPWETAFNFQVTDDGK
jgi:purine nucleosidase